MERSENTSRRNLVSEFGQHGSDIATGSSVMCVDHCMERKMKGKVESYCTRQASHLTFSVHQEHEFFTEVARVWSLLQSTHHEIGGRV